jgi:hypothetical protein
VRIADAVDTLTQRRNWLSARIAAKQSVGWDVEWDTRERDSLTVVIDMIQQQREAA